ncbi:MAG: aldo/keto reductase [Ferroplasma sp.]
MIYREFGNTAFKCSVIGMGTYYDMRWIFKTYFGIYSNKGQKIDAIRTGIENGINLIDTAELYRSEKLIGSAIKGEKREDLFLSTKVFPTNLYPRALERSLNRSLKNLGTDYIDLYQIHFPNPAVDLKKTMGKLEELIDRGKIRYIGLSNFSLGLVQKTMAILKKYSISSVQVDYNIFHRKPSTGMIDYCKKNNIAVMAYFPLGHGRAARPQYNKYFDNIRKRIGDVPNANIALSYLISRNSNVFPIPRASTREHVLQNIKYSDTLLTEDEMKYMEEKL